MNRAHLSEDRLFELCLDGDGRSSEPHLAECERCHSRLTELAAVMTDVNVALTAAADEAFPPERLARQHARILQHIDHEGRPARVIAFPAAYASAVRVHRRPTGRWIAAAGAIAASFMVGVLADHLTHELPGARSVAAPRLAVRADENVPIRTVAASLSDDELLGQIEAAVGSTGPAALKALDAVTPRAWDVR